MGKFDILCKKYMSNNEVFADAFNYLLYNGKQKIKPEDLKINIITFIVLIVS